MPKRNEADLDDLPENVRRSMTFVLVDTVDEVLAAALDEAPLPREVEPTLILPAVAEEDSTETTTIPVEPVAYVPS